MGSSRPSDVPQMRQSMSQHWAPPSPWVDPCRKRPRISTRMRCSWVPRTVCHNSNTGLLVRPPISSSNSIGKTSHRICRPTEVRCRPIITAPKCRGHRASSKRRQCTRPSPIFLTWKGLTGLSRSLFRINPRPHRPPIRLQRQRRRFRNLLSINTALAKANTLWIMTMMTCWPICCRRHNCRT